MENFAMQYLTAFGKADPRGFNALARSGGMPAHLREVGMEANRLIDEILAPAPKDALGNPSMAARREAEEYVRAMLLEFPAPEVTPKQEAAPLPGPWAPEYGANNKVFTREAAWAARERLRVMLYGPTD